MTQKKFIFGGIFLAVFIFLFYSGAPAFGAAWCHNFTVNLKPGNRSYEVGALQAALQKEGFLLGRLDAIFGQRTKYALIAFQNKYKEEILTPLRLKNGTGFVGKGTLIKLNKLYGCSARSAAVAVPATSSIAVISPNGGEILTQGTDLSVKWTSSGLDKVSIILINYATGDQTEVINSVQADLGQYSWQIPSSVAAGNKYKITVRAGKTVDLSDNYFTIVSAKKAFAPSLILLSPLGGEQWEKGKAYSIKWLYQDVDKIDTIVLTDYSRNITYSLGNNIGASLNSNSFNWEISSAPSVIPVGDFYRIKLESCISGACYSAQSSSFSIK